MERAVCCMASSCGNCRRRNASCSPIREVDTGVEELGGKGVLLISVLLSFIIITSSPFSVCGYDTCPIFTYMCTPGHILPLPGWLAPFPQIHMLRHFCHQAPNSAPSWLVKGRGLPCCLLPSQEGQKLLLGKTVQSESSPPMLAIYPEPCPQQRPPLTDGSWRQLKLLTVSGSYLCH